jgi:hypothetical protein
MLAAIVTGWQTAWAHDWYPPDCCSGRDCAPLASGRVKVTPEGYIIDGIHSVPHRRVRWSPDEHYHGCFPGQNRLVLGCFWAPRQAM